MHYVEIEYDLSLFPEFDHVVEKAAKVKSIGSGGGCGNRDMTFKARTYSHALALLERLRPLKKANKITALGLRVDENY